MTRKLMAYRITPVNIKLLCLRCLYGASLASLFTGGFASAQSAASAASTPAVSAPAATPAAAIVVLSERYPSGSIQSEEVANQALHDVDQQNAALDRQYAEEQRLCYQKFFATSCLDAAKEKNRVASADIHKVEIEANSFIRSNRVAQRDKNLADKRAKDAANPPKPLADAVPKPLPQPSPNSGEQRIIDHAAKIQQEQRQEAANAPRRAEEVDAYNKKVQDAADRQRDVAKKKAEKERQAAAKAAAANKSASKPAAAVSASSSASTPAASSPAPAKP